MTFKEALAREAETVFLNPDEFAETEPIILNGVPCPAQVIGPEAAPRDAGDNRDGVSFVTAVIHIPSGLIPLPKADREIDWNGRKWMVSSARDAMGLYRIEVYRETS